MKRIFYLLLALIIALPTIADNDSKLRVAVFDPSSSGLPIDAGTKAAIREIISSTLVNTNNFEIVERSLLEQVMKEQQFSQSGAVDESQITEIGKLAGANKVVVSVITQTAGKYMLSIKMIDTKTASVEKQKVKVVASDGLLDIIEPLTLDVLNGTSSVGDEPVNSTPVAKSAEGDGGSYEQVLRKIILEQNKQFQGQAHLKTIVPTYMELNEKELLIASRDNTKKLFGLLAISKVKKLLIETEQNSLLTEEGKKKWEFLRDTKRVFRAVYYNHDEKKSKEVIITPEEVLGK